MIKVWRQMTKKQHIFVYIWLGVIVALFVACILIPAGGENENIKETMRDAVLHNQNKVSLFGMEINPAVVSAFAVTGIILLAAAVIRIFVIPKFKYVPGKVQTVLEQTVGMFEGMAKNGSPHRNGFLGVYIFGAASYIFIGTLFELFGIQILTTSHASVALPAPLSDINGAIALGCLSYLVILAGGIAANGWRGMVSTLKEFSLPLSMSLRLFGALLSGLLVTELVYHFAALSYGIPIFVAVLFTLLHALIQTYVLTMLTAQIYGEVTEPHVKKIKIKSEKTEKNQGE